MLFFTGKHQGQFSSPVWQIKSHITLSSFLTLLHFQVLCLLLPKCPSPSLPVTEVVLWSKGQCMVKGSEFPGSAPAEACQHHLNVPENSGISCPLVSGENPLTDLLLEAGEGWSWKQGVGHRNEGDFQALHRFCCRQQWVTLPLC